MVAEELNSTPVRHQLQAAGVTQFYNVLPTNTGEVRFPSYTSPTLHICVSSTSAQSVIATTRPPAGNTSPSCTPCRPTGRSR